MILEGFLIQPHRLVMEKQKDLTWLEHLQRNSWEPEVIISGIILAFLFVFPTKIYELSAMLVQDIGVGYIPSSLVLIYLSAIIGVFKIFFVVHLSLRFLWAGLLGLSYAFPEGVIQEKLFKSGRGLDYQKPERMVLRMEKICSMAFAYPLSLVIVFLGITVLLGLLVCIYVWFEMSFFYMYVLLMISVLGVALMFLVGKKNRLKEWYSKTIVSSVSAIYQSNLGKWFSIAYGILIFGLASPIIYADTKDFSLFFNETNLNDRELEWPAKNLYYESHHDPQKRYGRVFLPSEEMDSELLRLGLARYVEDEKILKRIKEEFGQTLESLNWQALDEPADLHRIYIDDQLVSVEFWRKQRLEVSGQKVYQTLIPIESLSSGVHRLRVEKLTLHFDLMSNTPEIKQLENWAVVDFIKL